MNETEAEMYIAKGLREQILVRNSIWRRRFRLSPRKHITLPNLAEEPEMLHGESAEAPRTLCVVICNFKTVLDIPNRCNTKSISRSWDVEAVIMDKSRWKLTSSGLPSLTLPTFQSGCLAVWLYGWFALPPAHQIHPSKS